MATELARVLANYKEAYALLRQIRATLKRARA
jgi:exonuclease VII small subunit